MRNGIPKLNGLTFHQVDSASRDLGEVSVSLLRRLHPFYDAIE